MSVYGYIALDGYGIEQRGAIEAHDERAARTLLREQRLRILHLQEGALPEDDGLLGRVAEWLAPVRPRNWMPVRPADLALMFRQLGLMLRAGHTLVHALDACARLTTKLGLRQVLHRLAEELRGGRSLSAAMKAEGKPFTTLMVSLIDSGEVSGELDTVLTRIADDIERRIDVKRQLIAALTYPSIIFLASIGVVTYLVMVVIPRFAAFLEGRGKDIPASARLLLDFSAWFAAWSPLLAAGLGAALTGFALAYATPAGRHAIDRAALFVPVLGATLTAASMAQLSWTLALLIRSGSTVLESLRVATRIVPNSAYAAALEQAADGVLGGRSLSHALKATPVPPLIRHMVEVGESSGELDHVMEEVGVYYRKELDTKVKLMAALIEPLLIVFVGTVVGFVYFVFFQTLMTASAR
ncbi:type II secretion system F family protein [Pseudothauera rhizosphaerae]|uniref:General secretion pathway protein F n=1 Tax=Pseudothauera rhizosphaerae TaxID=2565932 RepID=A0A4S4AS86_9RHOO|nr:type II secretion system F family protein [Pseudothauera rhizosphaerae]THF62682.1 type II secretion system F family protein [Pseudothauera rhizosphaerae]